MSESQFGLPVLVDDVGEVLLEKLSLNDNQYNEAYIQELAFRNPACLPVTEIDSAYEGLVPVCMELGTRAGPLDILFVTTKGRLVLVEAKLWRNPEARRKVIGQILDYAKELSNWSYEDLQREVSKATGKKGNVLYEIVKVVDASIEEKTFVDNVTRSLTSGNFMLLIIGDGIREGVAAITGFLDAVGKLEFTFGLVELALYKVPPNKTLVQPRVLAKTAIIKRIVVTTEDGGLLIDEKGELSDTSDEDVSGQTDLQKFYLDFWPEWLGGLQLDDPSQPLPKTTGTRGNIYFPMPPSGGQSWLTVYFSQQKNQVGVFLTFTRGEWADKAYSCLLDERDTISGELPPDVVWNSDGERHRITSSKFFGDLKSPENKSAIKEYFSETVNQFVNSFRPRLKKISEEM